MKQVDLIKQVGGIEHYDKDSDQGLISSREVHCDYCGHWVDDSTAALIDGKVICVKCVKDKYDKSNI